MKVRQMESHRGNPWANQFILEEGNKIELQSYSSLVVTYIRGEVPILHSDWDYSTTTSKAVYKFFEDFIPHGEEYHLRRNMLKAIKEGRVYYDNDIKYEVKTDLQGGSFGMDRQFTPLEWADQITEWTDTDDYFETDESREAYRHKMKVLASNDPQQLLDYISETWQLEFKEV